MNINFYIHPENINLNWYEKVPTTEDIFPSFFYLFFLPKNLKIKFLDNLDEDDKEIYKEILNISPIISKNIKSSDFIIIEPFYYSDNLLDSLVKNKKYIDESIKLNKKILLFCGDTNSNDFIPKNLPKNIILFTAGGTYFNNQNIIGLPTLSKDYFDGYFLNKKVLSISFCGILWSCSLRHKVIDILKRSTYSDFIIRDDWGGYDKFYYRQNSDRYFITVPPEKTKKQEFVENIKNNLYGLCIRGDENFSYRLSEVLMMGRIPIIIDTKCILPFKNLIPYEKNCIIINLNNLDNMIEIVEKYHNSHTEEQLLKIQKENRDIWLKYFTPTGAFRTTIKILEQIKKREGLKDFTYSYV